MSLISIIIPVYNTAEFLPRCIDSCINQTYSNIEIIIVIDGSPDNSNEIAKSYQKKDSRIIIINKENEGLPKTRRTGFENSTGDYIFHLDSDDYVEHNSMDLLLKTLLREQADIVVGGTRYENRDGDYITSWVSKISGNDKADYLKDIFSSNLQPNIWGRLIKREVFQPVVVPPEYECGEDFLANIMMICYSLSIKISVVPQSLYHYIVYKESLTNIWPAEVFMPYTDMIEKILIEYNLEKTVIKEWAWFRVIKVWRHYLRRGGIKYLNDKLFVRRFYEKYYSVVKNRLTFIERFELNLYRLNRFAGYNFSRLYGKLIQLTKNTLHV